MTSWIRQDKGRWLKDYRSKKGKVIKDEEKKEDRKKEEETKNQKGFAVIFYPLRCPVCKKTNIKCYGTSLPIRYHLCKDCGCNFKSFERD